MQMNRIARYIVALVMGMGALGLQAQELEAKVVVNHSKIQGTNTSVFTTLQDAMTEFLNSRKWTNAQYATREKIVCSLNLIVNEYSDDGRFACNLMVQANRPVYNASYNTTVLNFNDNAVDFNYIEHDKLEFSDDMIDNNLTAVLAYYAYLIIGLDMDTFRWGGMMRKLSIADSAWEDDPAFKYPVLFDSTQNPPTGDGGEVDPWKIKKPNVLQTNFYGQSVYYDSMTITEDQLETAFSSPDQLGSFLCRDQILVNAGVGVPVIGTGAVACDKVAQTLLGQQLGRQHVVHPAGAGDHMDALINGLLDLNHVLIAHEFFCC